MLLNTNPSYGTGFARSKAQAEYPGLWKGLVGAWAPFLGATGITLYDWSGNKSHGTFVAASGGGPDWITEPGGRALQFLQANTDRVEFGSPAAIDNVHTFTIILRLMISSTEATTSPVWEKTTASTDRKNVRCNMASGANKFETRVVTGSTHAVSISSNGVFADNEWFNAAITYNNTGDRKIRIYYNGREVSYATQTAATGTVTDDSSELFNWGTTPATNFFKMDGGITFGALYNRVLSNDEILQFNENPKSLFIPRRRVLGFVAVVGAIAPTGALYGPLVGPLGGPI